jgi:phospholipid transport system substrate-binding protein
MAENLDLEWMAKYSLGRHRKELNMPQIKDFTKIYSTYVIKTYSDLVRNYKGQKAVIKKVAQLDKSEFIVKTEVVQNGQPPLKVDYLVRNISTNAKKPILRISDIITEGVSMVNSQQAEFNSIFSNEGFDSLVNQLKKKI